MTISKFISYLKNKIYTLRSFQRKVSKTLINLAFSVWFSFIEKLLFLRPVKKKRINLLTKCILSVLCDPEVQRYFPFWQIPTSFIISLFGSCLLEAKMKLLKNRHRRRGFKKLPGLFSTILKQSLTDFLLAVVQIIINVIGSK